MDNLELVLTKILDFGDCWKVTEVKIDNVSLIIDLYLEYTESTGIFPRTNDSCQVYDLSKQRRVRHLDLFINTCGTLEDPNGLEDTYLYLLNSSGVLIASNNDNGDLCSGKNASLVSLGLTAGTYYIVAEPNDWTILSK
ncbi:MAG: hypothetical protein EAZ07_08870 [Cytophagales bacterium]|nr:MAG: hypothetical protein EAZ07_08870 [Cytophagales bacterium]